MKRGEPRRDPPRRLASAPLDGTGVACVFLALEPAFLLHPALVRGVTAVTPTAGEESDSGQDQQHQDNQDPAVVSGPLKNAHAAIAKGGRPRA